MPNDVFANGREVSCKAGSGKSICAFPDVCFTPPENPATPPGVPIPYPNTGLDSDATAGSKTVKISGKEVMLKNKSYFAKSTGDEAGCAAKKGVVTSVHRGKVYFNAWSMDVKIEGENVVRHLDLMTHNHASFPGNSPTWPFLDEANADSGACADVRKELKEKCVEVKQQGVTQVGTQAIGSGATPTATGTLLVRTKPKRKGGPTTIKRPESIKAMCDDPDCSKALKCVLSPYDPSNCCPQPQPSPPVQTPHHVVPKSQFHHVGNENAAIPLASGATYEPNKAPCICAPGVSHSVGQHGEIHAETNVRTRAFLGVPSGTQIPDQRWPVAAAERIGAESAAAATGCNQECIKEQVRNGHQQMGVQKSDQIRPTTAGGEDSPNAGPPIQL